MDELHLWTSQWPEKFELKILKVNNNENTMEILSHNENWSEARECQERIQCLEKALGFMQAELDKLQGVEQEPISSKNSKKRIQYDHITGTVFENYQKCRIWHFPSIFVLWKLLGNTVWPQASGFEKVT